MANLTESAVFTPNVYRIDENDPVQGWDGSTIGISNQQAKDLADRTQWLKARVDQGARITEYTNWSPSAPSDLLTLNPTDIMGKFIRVNVGTYDAEVQLPVANSVPDFGNVSISCEPGAGHQFLNSNGKVINLAASPGDSIIELATGNNVNQIIINPYTLVHVHKFNSTTYILYTSTKVENCPPGMIMAWPVNSPPYGWLECNGASVSRAAYAALFANVGLTFGNPGISQFNLPDLRGEFIRGWDNGRGVDIDQFILQATTTSGSANITNADTSGLSVGMSISGAGIPGSATILSITNSTTFVISGNATATANLVSLTVSKTRLFGSAQGDVFKLHTHKISRLSNIVNSVSPTTAAISDWENASTVQSTDNVQPVGGAETRPRNVALMYCIKY